jgi:hypothetical protein
LDEVIREDRAFIAGLGTTGEDPSEEEISEGDFHRSAEEADLCVGGDASGAGEDLKGDQVASQLDHLGEG